ncbi:rhomboid family intramembrane serine protease [Flavobacterium sp. KDG-16]|uniref:Rhomboid family intramembrane serine protease n=2 Tax=Flavobacterium difficile TaxID=2709659 RepID=A0ABX0I143_9FLAO|nr:rhomboid family intramembrane serine protease [Flavobacterium difficile]
MFNNMTPVVKQLLIINVIVFILSQVMPQNYITLSEYYFENANFRFWQPFTHMFMHAGLDTESGFMHILFNMFALVTFGSALEHYWGGKKFLFFYIVCGLGASLFNMGIEYYEIHHGIEVLTNGVFTDADISKLLKTNIVDGDSVYLQPLIDAHPNLFNKITDPNFDSQAFLNVISKGYTRAVGASGAIFGLMVAFAFMFPNVEFMMLFIPFPIKAKYYVSIIVVIGLFSGLFSAGGNVGHFAHVGGALTGFILMLLWRNNKFKHTRWN